jgi:molecular chaperone HtpG
MEKMYKAMGQNIPMQKRILELNPEHTLVKSMKKEFEKNIKSEKLKDLIKYAYLESLVLE